MFYNEDMLISSIDNLINALYETEDFVGRCAAIAPFYVEIRDAVNYIDNNSDYTRILIMLETLCNMFSDYYATL